MPLLYLIFYFTFTRFCLFLCFVDFVCFISVWFVDAEPGFILANPYAMLDDDVTHDVDTIERLTFGDAESDASAFPAAGDDLLR